VTNHRRVSVVERLYSLLLHLLPPSIRREDGEEMSSTFGDLWRDAEGAGRRLVLACRCVGQLLAVATLEWQDLLGITGTERTGGWDMTGWGRHLRLALRTLRKAPAFTVTSVVLIGLGVGAVTTIFTVVDHVLLRPLPYPAAERLITVRNGSHNGLSFRGFQAFNGVEEWVAATGDVANLTGVGDPVQIEIATVTEGFFGFFGARPAVGRFFVAEDFEADQGVVITHATWRNIFGADPDLVGRSIQVDGRTLEVLGVVDADFEPPSNMVPSRVALFRPVDWSAEMMTEPGYRALEVAGRMAPGVTLPDVQLQLDALTERLGREYPDQMLNREGVAETFPAIGLQDATVQRVRTGLNLLLGAVGMLLLVACLNVAHLFLARGLGRSQEMAVRRALGAGAGGLTQQLLAESLVVGVVGGLAGLGVAQVGLGVLMAMNPFALPRADVVGLDFRVAAFAALVSLSTAVFFGLLPALRSIGSNLTDELRGASRGTTTGKGTRRLRNGLVVVEVALSLVLVAQAGLLLKSFMQVQAHDTGFRVEGLWTLPLTPTDMDAPGQYERAMDAVAASLASLPGVASTTYGLTQPFEFTGGGRCCWSNRGMAVNGVENDNLRVMYQPVTATYFETLGIPLHAGTVWSKDAAEERPVPTVVTERLAIDAFGSVEAAMGGVLGDEGELQLRIVGVAGDTKHYGLDQPDPTSAYVPISAIPFDIPMAHMAVRVEGEAPSGLARSLREAVWAVSPEIPVPTVRSMEDWIGESIDGRRFDSAVFGAFGVAALLLAAAGLYGTLLYNVRQQRRELGIRIALGAERSRVERRVVGGGLRLALLGTFVGLVAASGVGRLMESRLYEVGTSDPATLLSAALVLLTTAALASWLPARRAGRTDPLETLKAE